MSGLVSAGKGGPLNTLIRGRKHPWTLPQKRKYQVKVWTWEEGGQIQGGGKMLREGRPCLTQCQGGESERTRAGRFLYTAVMGVSDSAGVSDGM